MTGGKLFVGVNAVFAFVLEIVAFAAVGYGAFALVSSAWLGALLGAAAVLLTLVVWGLFAAPRARYRNPLGVVLVKALVFAAAAVALASNAHVVLGIVLVVAVALNALALQGTEYGYLATPGHSVTNLSK